MFQKIVYVRVFVTSDDHLDSTSDKSQQVLHVLSMRREKRKREREIERLSGQFPEMGRKHQMIESSRTRVK